MRQAKIQEIQQRLNTFVADRGRRKKVENANRDKNLETTEGFSTTFFESSDVPYYHNTGDKKLLLMEELPEILDGIKMTTTIAEMTTGMNRALLF